MFRPSPAPFVFLLCTLFLGCAALRSKKPVHAKPTVAAGPQSLMVGTISLVNEDGKFVLIDNGSLPGAPTGVKLKSYTAGKFSAELQTTDVRRHPFTIADIRSGKPLKGDRVYYEPHGAATPGPAPATPGPAPAAAARSVPNLPWDLPPQLSPGAAADQ